MHLGEGEILSRADCAFSFELSMACEFSSPGHNLAAKPVHELSECFDLPSAGACFFEVSDHTNADGGEVGFVVFHMPAKYLFFPAGAYFDFAIA